MVQLIGYGDMKKQFLSTLFILIVIVHPRLKAQIDPSIDQKLTDIFFTNSQSGWVVGDHGVVYLSSDGGSTWSIRQSGTISNLTTIHFINDQRGWVGGENGIILSTINSGETWQNISGSFDEEILDIHFIDDSIGFSLSSNAIRKTSDGGISWKDLDGLSQPTYLRNLEILDNNIFWVLRLNAYLFRTLDGGSSFDTTLVGWIILGNSSYSHNMITSWNDSSAMVVGKSCIFILDIDDMTCSGYSFIAYEGEDLDRLPSNLISFHNGLAASERIGEEHGWVVGDSGLIAMTDSAGRNWKIQKSETVQDLIALSFIDTLTGWVLGKNNLILRTTDGGENWSTLVSIDNREYNIQNDFTLSQNHPNPFNPVTTIEYTLSRSGEVSLIIYNILGKEVARLVDGEMTAGNHTANWDASNFASGIYFYRLQAGDFVLTRKMVLLK